MEGGKKKTADFSLCCCRFRFPSVSICSPPLLCLHSFSELQNASTNRVTGEGMLDEFKHQVHTPCLGLLIYLHCFLSDDPAVSAWISACLSEEHHLPLRETWESWLLTRSCLHTTSVKSGCIWLRLPPTPGRDHVYLPACSEIPTDGPEHSWASAVPSTTEQRTLLTP